MSLTKKKLVAISTALNVHRQKQKAKPVTGFSSLATPKAGFSLWALAGRQQLMADRLAMQRRAW